MPIPLFGLQAQYSHIRHEINDAVQRVLDHCQFILGDEVDKFEREFAEYVRAKGAVGVASGTSALRLALQACGIQAGDKVITASHTFIATAEAISQLGAEPVFVDIDPRTYTLDPNQVETSIRAHDRGRSGPRDGRIRAIVPVHLYGHPADMDALTDIARRYELKVVEDAAQAHGAEWNGQPCGSLGDLASFSFHPTKNLGAYGDGGMVTGNDEGLLARVRRLRDHGRTTKYEHDEIGSSDRLDAIQAAILGVKLPHLSSWTEARRNHARRYIELLGGCDAQVPYAAPLARHAYHLFVIRTARRDALLAHLNARGIGAGIHYPVPVHKQPVFVRQRCGGVHLPHTEAAAAEVLSLPMYPELTADEVLTVSEAVKELTG